MTPRMEGARERIAGYSMESMPRPASRRRPIWLAACAVAGAGSMALASTAVAAPSILPGSGQYWNALNPTPSYSIDRAVGEPVTWSASGPGFSDTGILPTGSGTVDAHGLPRGRRHAHGLPDDSTRATRPA